MAHVLGGLFVQASLLNLRLELGHLGLVGAALIDQIGDLIRGLGADRGRNGGKGVDLRIQKS